MKLLLKLILFLLFVNSFSLDDLEGFGEDEEVDNADIVVRLDPDIITGIDSAAEHRTTKDTPDQASSASFWDADEFEGLEQLSERPRVVKETINLENRSRRRQSIWKKQESYTRELVGLALLAVYLLNIFWGKLQNEALALKWVRTFAGDNGMIQKNFAFLGPADGNEGEVLMKESHSCFKFYSTGRRYCRGMYATLDLRGRQDLFSLFLYTIVPRKDVLDIEVHMNEGDMPPMVCVLASPKQMKILIRENEDINAYAREIPVKHIPNWPLNKVQVWTESPVIFYDLMTPELKKLFLSPEFDRFYSRYFRYIYITSDHGHGNHKEIIKFSFNLPSVSKMGELTVLMNLIPVFIDLVAEYNPSQEELKRAGKHRQMENERAWKDGAEERKEAFQQKKTEEQLAELERIRRLPPAEREKAMEKLQKLKQRRSTKVKMIRG